MHILKAEMIGGDCGGHAVLFSVNQGRPMKEAPQRVSRKLSLGLGVLKPSQLPQTFAKGAGQARRTDHAVLGDLEGVPGL